MLLKVGGALEHKTAIITRSHAFVQRWMECRVDVVNSCNLKFTRAIQMRPFFSVRFLQMKCFLGFVFFYRNVREHVCAHAHRMWLALTLSKDIPKVFLLPLWNFSSNVWNYQDTSVEPESSLVTVQQSLLRETMQSVAAIEFLVIMLTVILQTFQIFYPAMCDLFMLDMTRRSKWRMNRFFVKC